MTPRSPAREGLHRRHRLCLIPPTQVRASRRRQRLAPQRPGGPSAATRRPLALRAPRATPHHHRRRDHRRSQAAARVTAACNRLLDRGLITIKPERLAVQASQRRRDAYHDDRNYDELEGKPLQVLPDRPDQRSHAFLEHHHRPIFRGERQQPRVPCSPTGRALPPYPHPGWRRTGRTRTAGHACDR